MALLLAGACSSRADLTGVNLWSYNSDVMTCYGYGFQTNSPGNYQLSIDGQQLLPAVAQIGGDILANSETDPTLTLDNEIDNDTGITWDDYHVTIEMSKSFSFSNVAVDNGWTINTTAPVQVGSDWIGYIDYYAGTPVPNGGTLDFSFSLTFVGGASFQEDLVPSPVPEPATAGCFLLGLGALACCRRFTKNRRS